MRERLWIIVAFYLEEDPSRASTRGTATQVRQGNSSPTSSHKELNICSCSDSVARGSSEASERKYDRTDSMTAYVSLRQFASHPWYVRHDNWYTQTSSSSRFLSDHRIQRTYLLRIKRTIQAGKEFVRDIPCITALAWYTLATSCERWVLNWGLAYFQNALNLLPLEYPNVDALCLIWGKRYCRPWWEWWALY